MPAREAATVDLLPFGRPDRSPAPDPIPSPTSPQRASAETSVRGNPARWGEAALAERLQACADAALAGGQLALEPLDLAAARADELQLVGDVHERLLEDLALLARVLGVLPLLAQPGAGGLGLHQPLEVVERQAQ